MHLGSRWFSTVVVLFWLGSMSWLVVDKVLPPLQRGEPPNYRSIYGADDSDAPVPPVGWQARWNDELIGWATTRIERRPGGVIEVNSRVHLDLAKLRDDVPPIFKPFLDEKLRDLNSLPIEATSKVEIDPLGQLSRLESSLQVVSWPVMRLQGVVDGSRLKLKSYFLDKQHTFELPADAMIGDELSPQAMLPNLRLGQTWTVPVYSALRPQPSPARREAEICEILQAKVERQDSITWDGETRPTMVVVYRPDSGAGLRSAGDVRGRMWVAADGRVLRQEINLFDSRLTFSRLGDKEAVELVRQHSAPNQFTAPPPLRPRGKAGRP